MTKLRPLLFIFIILALATSIFSYVFLDNDFLIRKWSIPFAPHGFHDSRQFAWAAEAHALGYDPLIENPVNPRGHQLNYPRIWHLLFNLGINESHTNLFGSVVVILFFIGIGIFWFSKKFDNLTYILLSILILSPAVMLGIERSNIELILFFILSLALTISYRSTISSLFVFLFASVLKIYPVFGFIYLLKENKKKFWTLFLSAIGIFILYALLSFNDFYQVYSTTPKLVGSSFGINVLWMGIEHPRHLQIPISNNLAVTLKTISYAIAFLILSVTIYFSIFRENAGLYNQGQYLDAFRVGAGIYIGCFLLMNTHDYRLIFLIFAIPQIVAWLRVKGKTSSLLPHITLATMIFSLWSFVIRRILGRKITFVMEELCNWIMLACLLYLLFCSLPSWLRDDLRRPFSGTKRS